MYWSPSIAAKRPHDLAANQPFRDKCQVVVAHITFVDGTWDFRISNVPPEDEVQLILPDNCAQ